MQLKGFEYEVRRMAEVIRKRLSDENIPSMHIEIDVSGNTHDRLKIIYKLGQSWVTDTCEGADLGNVVEEFVRRYHWTQNNKPVALAPPPEPLKAPVEVVIDGQPVEAAPVNGGTDEIPF